MARVSSPVLVTDGDALLNFRAECEPERRSTRGGGFHVVLADEDMARFARYERWALKETAEEVLCRKVNGVDQNERLKRCYRYALVKKGETLNDVQVEIWRSPTRMSASFAKVETCSSVWNCPVCSAKVTERRKQQLIQVVSAWREKGGSLALATITFPHGAGNDLSDISTKFLAAWRAVTEHRTYKDLRKRFGIEGYARALEVTHGQAHGWHPHCHFLMFFEGQRNDAEMALFKQLLHPIWVAACARQGLPAPSFKHGLDVRLATGSSEEVVAAYVAKYGCEPKNVPTWSLEAEVVKGHSKRGTDQRRTPWDFLRFIRYEQDDETMTRNQAAALFRDYSNAFFGRAQLQWSKGKAFSAWRKSVIGEDKTEAEIAQERAADDTELWVSFDHCMYRRITWARAHGRVLEFARKDDMDGFLEIMSGLPEPRSIAKTAPRR